MLMPIYIPSHARASEEEIRRGPLLRLPLPWCARTHYVVPTGQGAAYRDVLDGLEHEAVAGNVLETPEEYMGIGWTRYWLAQHAAGQGADKLVMMDDDVDFLVRRSPEDWQLVAQAETDTREMLQMMEKLLDTHAMVGVSSREGNNRAGVGPPLADNMVAVNTRVMRVFGVRVADWLAMEHGRVRVMEDFDLTLQLLQSGRSNCCLFYWANGQRMTNSPGGCSTYRSREVQDEAARKLQKLHGSQLVRLRQKENRTDREGLGTRTEVTVAWKRAAAEGLARRAGDGHD